LRTLHQKPYFALSLPFVGIQSEGQFHPTRQLLGAAKPDAVYGLTLVFEFQGEVFLAH
jgi:hypothetical protein